MTTISLPWRRKTKTEEAKPVKLEKVDYGPFERVAVVDSDNKIWYAKVPHYQLVRYFQGYWGRYQWGKQVEKYVFSFASWFFTSVMLIVIFLFTVPFSMYNIGTAMFIGIPFGLIGWKFGTWFINKKTMWVVRRNLTDKVLTPVIGDSLLQNYVAEDEKISVRSDWLHHLIEAASLKILRRKHSKGLEKLEFGAIVLLIIAILAVCFLFGMSSRDTDSKVTGTPTPVVVRK